MLLDANWLTFGVIPISLFPMAGLLTTMELVYVLRQIQLQNFAQALNMPRNFLIWITIIWL